MTTYAQAVSSNGQVSIPAAVRRRWHTSRVLVIDKGDRIIVRPVPDDPIGSIIGKYAGGATSDEIRQTERAAEAERDVAR